VSILLIAPPEELGRAVVERLIAQDDEVRVLEPAGDRAGAWRDLGAFVATGQVSEDLVERAAYNVRTIVVFAPSMLEGIIESARLARVGRLVVIVERPSSEVLDRLADSDLDFVVLVTGRLRRRMLERAAEAIDAADDLPGEPRMAVDLRSRDARSLLRLSEEYERPTP
jgi:hypothetical protein